MSIAFDRTVRLVLGSLSSFAAISAFLMKISVFMWCSIVARKWSVWQLYTEDCLNRITILQLSFKANRGRLWGTNCAFVKYRRFQKCWSAYPLSTIGRQSKRSYTLPFGATYMSICVGCGIATILRHATIGGWVWTFACSKVSMENCWLRVPIGWLGERVFIAYESLLWRIYEDIHYLANHKEEIGFFLLFIFRWKYCTYAFKVIAVLELLS